MGEDMDTSEGSLGGCLGGGLVLFLIVGCLLFGVLVTGLSFMEEDTGTCRTAGSAPSGLPSCENIVANRMADAIFGPESK